MSRRPNLLRRAAQAYMEYIDSAAAKVERLMGRAQPAEAPSTSTATTPTTPATSTLTPSRSLKPDPPACFSATSLANRRSPLRNIAHYLGYTRQPQARTIFALTPTDSTDAFRVLDDRPFGGRTEARVRRVERVDEDGKPVSVLLYEGFLHPLPPFQSRGSRWMEDLIRPPLPTTTVSSTSHPSAALPVGPTGITTPIGMLNGFSSLTSPNYTFPDLNLTPYTHLAFRIRTDGRPYTLSLRCSERLPLVYQARVPESQLARPTHWKEIRFDHFLTTFQGQMQTLQFSLPRSRIANWGLSVTGPPGPFWLELERVEARRGLTKWEKAELTEDERLWREEEERRSRGEKFLWWLTDKERATLDRFMRRGKEGKEEVNGPNLGESDGEKDAMVRKEEGEKHGEHVEVDEDEDERARQMRKETAEYQQRKLQQ